MECWSPRCEGAVLPNEITFVTRELRSRTKSPSFRGSYAPERNHLRSEGAALPSKVQLNEPRSEGAALPSKSQFNEFTLAFPHSLSTRRMVVYNSPTDVDLPEEQCKVAIRFILQFLQMPPTENERGIVR